MMNMNFPKEPAIELRFHGFDSRPLHSELCYGSSEPFGRLRFQYLVWPVMAFVVTYALATANAAMLWVVGGMGVGLAIIAAAVYNPSPDGSRDSLRLSELLEASAERRD